MGIYKPFINIGPGNVIREELESRGWSQKTLSDITGIPNTRLNKIISNSETISYDRAKILALAFGTSPQLWINLDANFRLRQESLKEKEQIAVKSDIFLHMPIRDMIKKSWIRPYMNSMKKLIEEVKKFWGMDKIDFSFMESPGIQVHYRSRKTERYNSYYAQTWLRKAKLCSENYSVKSFDRRKFIALANSIPDYTVRKDGVAEFLSELNACGIKIFILHHLEKTFTDGVAFFDKKSENPVIVLTLRYNRLDNFWFTLSHEIGHIALHVENNRDELFLDSNLDKKDSGCDEIETEADKFAAECLKQDEILGKVRLPKIYPNYSSLKWAEDELGIHSAVILGTLQVNGKVSYKSSLNCLKTKLDDLIPEKYFAA